MPIQPATGSSPPAARHAWNGFVPSLLLILVLGVAVWQAGSLRGPDPDEIRSILLSRLKPRELVGTAPLVDQFPYGYPFALGVWNRAGQAAGIPEGLAWSRLPGLLAFAAALATAACLGRRVAGPGAGAALAATLALSGQGTLAASRMDGAALAGPALLVALLVLLRLYRRERRRRAGFLGAAGLWIIYMGAAILALSTHRLAWPAVAALGMLWLILCLVNNTWRTRFIEGGAWAHFVILMATLPLTLPTPMEERTMATLAQGWLTPWSRGEWLHAFLLGHCAGTRAELLAPAPWDWQLSGLAVAAALFPLGLVLRRALFLRRLVAGGADRGARLLALGGGFVALGSFALLRLLQASPWQRFFALPADGYPAWTAWAAAIAGLACWGGRWRGRVSNWIVWAALIPWFAAGLAGQALEIRHELRRAEASQHLLTGAMASQAPLYLMPQELAPYLPPALKNHAIKPLEAIATAASTTITLASLNPQPLLTPPRDILVTELTRQGQLAKTMRQEFLPAGPGLELLHLSGLNQARIAGVAARGFQFTEASSTSGTLVELRPQDLLPGDGWSQPEIDKEGHAWRWSRRDQVRFRFPVVLPAGDYLLHLKGMRPPHPPGKARWTMRFKWDTPQFEVEVPEGWFEVEVPIRLTHLYRRNYLDLTHPTVHLNEVDPASGDPRRLGFLFLKLWVTPAR